MGGGGLTLLTFLLNSLHITDVQVVYSQTLHTVSSGPVLWNELPADFRSVNSVSVLIIGDSSQVLFCNHFYCGSHCGDVDCVCKTFPISRTKKDTKVLNHGWHNVCIN